MLLYALDNPAPSSIVLISRDRGYAQVLSRLTFRGYHVVIVTSAAAQAGLRLAHYNEMYEWTDQLTLLDPAVSNPTQVNKSITNARHFRSLDTYDLSIHLQCPIHQQCRRKKWVAPSQYLSFVNLMLLIHQPSAVLKVPTSHRSKKIPAEEGFFSSAPKPVATLTVQEVPPSHRGEKLIAEEGFFSSASKPLVIDLTGHRGSDSEAKPQKIKPSQSKGTGALSSSDAIAIEPEFQILVDILQEKRREGVVYLTLSDMGAALLRKDKDIYEKAGVKSAKRYAALAHKNGVVVFASDVLGGVVFMNDAAVIRTKAQ